LRISPDACFTLAAVLDSTSGFSSGKQEGVDLIEVDNGKLTFAVIPTRGMGLLRAQMGDIRLGWDSPVKEVVNPAYINLDPEAAWVG
jgi:hypothetical protein